MDDLVIFPEGADRAALSGRQMQCREWDEVQSAIGNDGNPSLQWRAGQRTEHQI